MKKLEEVWKGSGASSSSQGVSSNSQRRLESKDLPSVRRLGKGLSGFLYETTWEGNKYVRKDFPLGSVNHKVFEKEAIALLELEHPNIVKCSHYTVGKSSCSLLLEYVDDDLQNVMQRRIEAQRKRNPTDYGTTLRSRVLDLKDVKSFISNIAKEWEMTKVESGMDENGTIVAFEVPEAVDIMFQIAAGLWYLHDRGVVHGDLKPKNVLLCWEAGKMIVKVADFGLTETKRRIKLVSKRTRHFEILMWKAPERFLELLGPLNEDSDDPFTDSDTDLDEGIRSVDIIRACKADVYSFGLICSHILGGKFQYRDLSLTQLRNQMSNGCVPKLPSACPENVRSLIYSCLYSESSRRPSFFSIVQALKGLQLRLPSLINLMKDRALYPVKTPEFSMELITESLKKAQVSIARFSTEPPKFNYGMCTDVVGKLNVAVQSALSYLERFPKCFQFLSHELEAKRVETFNLLFASAEQVDSFIEGCCKPDASSLAAIILSNVSEHISSVVSFNLELCTIVFLGSKYWESAKMIEADRRLKAQKAITSKVGGEITQDKKTLLENVRALGKFESSSKSSSEENQLATFLLQKLERSSLGYGPNVWEIDYKSLELKEQLEGSAIYTLKKATWLGVPVIVKTFLRPKHKAFEEQVTILSRLSHPNIVSLLCRAIDDGWCALVMELMDESLFSMIKHQNSFVEPPLTLLESVDLMLQAGEGMLYLHENHIELRNLTPYNILVKYAKSLTVGIPVGRRYFHAKVDVDVNCNQPQSWNRWAAPELIQLQHEKSLNYYQGDIYSFAMVFYQVLTGKMPFPTVEPIAEVKEKVLLGERPELPSHCAHKLKQLIQKCWDQDASNRPSLHYICEELRHLKYLLVASSAFLTTQLDGLNAPGFIRHRCCQAFSPAAVSLGGIPNEKDSHCGNCAIAAMWIEEDMMARMSADELNPIKNLFQLEPHDVEVLNPIGMTAFGDISRVTWRTCTFAMKRHQSRELFDRELDVAIRVTHPNIVQYFGYSSLAFNDYTLYMELLDTDLQSFLYRTVGSGLSFQDSLHVLLQVSEAMKCLHEKNFVHGDLKPSNILMNCYSLMHCDAEQYLVKVADFAMSQRVDSSGATVKPFMSGTLTYTAPEILRWRRSREGSPVKHVLRTDIYSFGVVAYQVLTGLTELYQGTRYSEVRDKVIQGLRPDFNLDGALDGDRMLLLPLIRSCWDEIPQLRPSFSEICLEIQALLQRESNSSTGPMVKEQTKAEGKKTWSRSLEWKLKKFGKFMSEAGRS